MLSVYFYAQDPNVQNRFWKKVDKNGPKHPYEADLGRCWSWTGTTDKKGYGRIKVGSRTDGTRTNIAPHRIVCAMYGKDMQPNLECSHSCDNRNCVNPDHIHMVDHTRNVEERSERGRTARGISIKCAKLTDEVVLRIRADFRTHSEIANELGLHEATIGSARNRKTWKHVA